MRTLYLLKSLFLLLAMVVGSTTLWATEVTFLAGTDTGASSVTKDGITVSMTTMSRSDNYRAYSGSDMTISSTAGTITKVEVTCTASGTSDYGPGNFSGTGYTYSAKVGTWSGSATTVTLHANALVRMTKIVVTFTPAASSYTISAISNNAEYGTVSVSGNKITATPATGYRVSTATPYEVTSGEATVTQNGNEFTVTASADCTVRINFEVLPTYTVTFSDGGSVTEASYGAGVTLPAREATADYTFVGWSDTRITTETASAPSIIAAGAYNPIADITLYPIYKRTADGKESKTATVIISNYATANNWVKTTGQYQTVSIDNNITATATNGQYTGYYTNDGWKFYQTDGGKLTLTAANGCELTSATLTFTANNNGTLHYGATQVASNTPVSLSGTTAEFEVKRTGNGSNGQIAFSKMVVNYNQNTVNYYTSHPITTATITLNAACNDGSMVYGTYSSSRAFVVSNDIVVSEIRVTNDRLEVYSYSTGDIVPANTGVMVSALEGGDHTVQLATGGTSILGNDNMLKPTGDNGISADDMNAANTKFYRLTMHNGTQIGYWWGAENGAAFSLAANKAFLAVPCSANARIQSLWFENETTGIGVNDVRGKMDDVRGEVYDLQGRRVTQPTKGLYIQNGRKFVIK